MPPVRLKPERPQGLPQLDPSNTGKVLPLESLSGRELRWAMWGAMKAALLIAGIFSAVMILFVAFLRFIWRV
ncbi:MAG: hypothetical protein LBS72_01790 [Oscillospiraceae bacterium]|jgi:hypothetical protein|nr:hypothetical protein [Oscillospiraceae bacterium]